MVWIFIVTLGGGERDAGGVLAGETFFRGLLVGMDLNRERLSGAQHFKQERQLTKAGGNLVAEQGGFIRVNHLAQRTRLAVGRQDLRAALRMRPHPQLRHRQVVRVGNAIQFS